MESGKGDIGLTTKAKSRIYNEDGYPDIDYMLSHRCPVVVIISGRGTGKTFSILDYFVKNKIKFLYMRRTKVQMACACDKSLNVFNVLNNEKGYNVQGEFKREIYAEFWDRTDERDERLLAVGAPLATFYNIRGFSASDFNYLFFDEITPEPTEKTSTKEERAFLNVIESVNRNRELQGREPIQMILAGNADTLNCPVLRALNLVKIVEKMVREGREEYVDKERGIAVYWLVNSPIAKKKADTFLYRTTKNKTFKKMAIENRFKDLDASAQSIKVLPPSQLIPKYSINGEIFVYREKSNNFLYISEKNYSVEKNYDFVLTADKKRFIIKERNSLESVIEQKAIYESFDIKARFGELVFGE